jgi:thiamine biosynthesis lipoprotein
MRNQAKPPVKKIALLTLCLILAGCQNQQLHREARVMMGTFVEVTSPDKRALDIVFSEIKRIEDLLSKYKEDSEISRLNKLGRLAVSPDTFYILEKSKEFWQISDGAFDITVGPLMDLWGFSDKKFRVPQDENIKNTLRLVGMDKIILHKNNSVVEFCVSGMKIDLGAIAKGYALDCTAIKLKKAGINSCLINAGGQVYGLGYKFGKPWTVAIKSPQGFDFIGYVDLKDRSAATSGDYEQFFVKENKRYCHIFNPKTGYPENSGLASVTVVANNGLTADALATAIFVLGKDKGMELAKKFPDASVKIFEKKR